MGDHGAASPGLGRLRLDTALPAYSAEGGPLQNLRLARLAASLGLGLWTVWRCPGPEWRVWFYLLVPAAFLVWQEADLDKDHLSLWLGASHGVRMFSWSYLAEGDEVPLRLKVLFGVVSMGLVVLGLLGCWRCRAAWPAFWSRLWSGPRRFWLMASGLFFALPVAMERLGLESRWAPGVRNPFGEEAPELLGTLAWLCLVIHLWEAGQGEHPGVETGSEPAAHPG